ncbi:hypothetical protein SAMN04487917_10321 [Arthrobacter sp. yr096]|uniref:hypothetical protein n=1 Tax=Arthrobacter sp. yr096 TaxID=1761750 RepID=UPI0008C2CCB9|nr:hypothetical protein SAMN04487917_10321 [Arthrobacter sp. yr096]
MRSLAGGGEAQHATPGIIIAALIIAGIAVREGVDAWRGDACCAGEPGVVSAPADEA